MRYLINDFCVEPGINLATEEYLFSRAEEEPLLMLWQNRSSVIIGRNQNTAAEINARYAEENDIRIIRRITGGGAVYHDLGNLNYSFIVKADGEKTDFRFLAEPLVQVLRAMGVPAEISGRNDLILNGRKFSGTAQYRNGSHILHHGTLLHSVDFDKMTNVLHADPEKIRSKGIESVRSRVVNIADYLPGRMTIEELEKALITGFSMLYPMVPFTLSEEDKAAICILGEEKYGKWEWNFGKSPESAFRKKNRLPCGTVETYWDEIEGRMKNITLRGDFLFRENPHLLEEALENVPYRLSSVREVLIKPEMISIFPNTEPSDLLKCFF